MVQGPFSIEISEVAEKVDPAALSKQEQQSLLEGVLFDPKEHDIFRFFIAPITRVAGKNSSKRTIKKMSYEMADRAYVDAFVMSNSFRLLGMFPRGHARTKGYDLDFEGEASAAPLNIGRIGLKLSGKLKNIFSRTARDCWAFRTDRRAQWIFKKSWIEEGNEFRLELVMLVPKDLDAADRMIYCSAKFADRDRSLARIEKRPIRLPAES